VAAPAIRPAVSASYQLTPNVGLMFTLRGEPIPPFEVSLGVGFWFHLLPYSEVQ
jgi:hypothetical protein